MSALGDVRKAEAYLHIDLIKGPRKYPGMRGLSVLADPRRQQIVQLLADGAMRSGEIAARFELSAPAVSQHLKALREAGLVRVRVDAQRRIYDLDPDGVEALSLWVAQLKRFWSPRLDALHTALAAGEETGS